MMRGTMSLKKSLLWYRY